MRRDHSTPDEGLSEERSQPDSEMTMLADLDPESKEILTALLLLTAEQRKRAPILLLPLTS